MNKAKIFRVYENISIHSFKKKNILSLSSQLILDVIKLKQYITRIVYLRVLSYKLKLLSKCIVFYAHTTVSAPLMSFVYYVYNVLFLYNLYSLLNSRSLLPMYVNNVHLLHGATLHRSDYILFTSYYQYVFCYAFYFITSSLFTSVCNGVATLPTRIRRYTVLRSPHTDKKSREQFELRTHKRVFKFPSCFSSYNSYTCFMNNSVFLCTYAHTHIISKYDSF